MYVCYSDNIDVIWDILLSLRWMFETVYKKSKGFPHGTLLSQAKDVWNQVIHFITNILNTAALKEFK